MPLSKKSHRVIVQLKHCQNRSIMEKLEIGPDPEQFKALEPLKETPIGTVHGIAAIALSMALKYHDVTIIKDGAMYQQYKGTEHKRLRWRLISSGHQNASQNLSSMPLPMALKMKNGNIILLT